MLLDLLFLPKQLTVAIKVECAEDLEDLDLLLSQARAFGGGCAKHPPVVLLSADLAKEAEADAPAKARCIDVMERYGADCYLVEMDSKD